jgi:phage head maturation protease
MLYPTVTNRSAPAASATERTAASMPSAGFAVASSGDEWHGPDHRRVRRALLDHISLVPQPAYEAARITAVRRRELLGSR